MFHMPELQALSPWVAAFGVSPSARVETSTGLRPASELAVGDLVMTRDNGLQPLSDVRVAVGAPAERNHYPIWISQGALGFGLPLKDLELGPQHRVLFEHIRVPLMFGEDAVLVRAKSLSISHDTVAVRYAVTPASYVQLSLAQQALIMVEGIAVESMLHDGECTLPYTTVRSWELMAAVA